MREDDLILSDGRRLHYYDWKPAGIEPALTLFWHHGTPNIGRPPAPLMADLTHLGIRCIGYDRPGYVCSSSNTGRTVASCADDVARIADLLGIDTFAVMGHSGGGPHALACAALLPQRVIGAVSVAGLAPIDAEGLDWYAGMAPSGEASLRAAAQGRAAKVHYENLGLPFDRDIFTLEDWDVLTSTWSWFDSITSAAMVAGPDGLIDDDMAYVTPWGFDPGKIACPVLLVHGEQDRVVPSAHSEWLAQRCHHAEYWPCPEDGHISVLRTAAPALSWLRGLDAST